MKVIVYVLWLCFWWGMPAFCWWAKGRYINFFMFLCLVATTTTLAGFLYLWPMGPWRDEGINSRR